MVAHRTHRNYANFKSRLAVVAAVTAADVAPRVSKTRAPRKAKSVLASVPAPVVMATPEFGRSMERATLCKALRRLTSVADVKSSLTILSHVVIRASGADMLLCATDLNVTLTVRIPAAGSDNAGMCLPAASLLDMVKLLPGGEVNLRRDESGVRLLSDKVEARMVGIPDRDFPKIPDSSEVAMVSVDADMLSEMIAGTLYAACKDGTRSHLNGALLESDGATARMVTTDGHRLVMMSRPLGMAVIAGRIIPSKGLQELGKMLSPGHCYVGMTASHVFVRQSGMELAVKCIDALFPPYDQVIPKDNPSTVTVDRVKLLAAAKRAAMLTSETRGVSLATDADTHELVLTCDHPEIGRMAERIDVTAMAGRVISGVRPEYLVETLSHIDEAHVTLSFKGELDPILVLPASSAVKPLKDADSIAVIMPMRQ